MDFETLDLILSTVSESSEILDDIISMIVGIFQGIGIMGYILSILAMLTPYILNGYMFMCMGRKARLEDDWMPFFPITRQLYQLKIVNYPWWYIFFFQGTFVSVIGASLISFISIRLFESAFLTVFLLLLYVIAIAIVTILYYRSYYRHFGFNPNTAWVHVVVGFGWIPKVLHIFIAFSDAIRYREDGEELLDPQGSNSRFFNEFNSIAPSKQSTNIAVVSGVLGKYAGASFDISDGTEVTFGRSASEANIVFDQFETDISRKHCSVRYNETTDQFIVTDLSTNGTYTDSNTLTPNQPISVKRGTIIYLGKNKKNSFRLG